MRLSTAFLLPALGTTGMVVLYFIGVKYHEVYYATLRIASSRFSQETVTYWLYGVDAIRQSAFEATKLIFSDPRSWVLMIVGGASLMLPFTIDGTRRVGRAVRAYRQPFARSRWRKWGRWFLNYLLRVLVVCYGLALLPVMVGVIIVVPTVVGAVAGEKDALRLLAAAQQCPAILEKDLSYARVHRDGKVLAEGIVAGTHATRMALVGPNGAAEYDVGNLSVSYHAGFPLAGGAANHADAESDDSKAPNMCRNLDSRAPAAMTKQGQQAQ